jgi:hypothetical protein
VEDAEVTYNGASNTLAVAASFPGAEATVLYGLSADGPFTSEVPAFKDAGEHPVWVVATAPGYPAVTNAATLTVRKKAIDPSMMCVVPDQVWDGTPKTPAVHIRDGWPDILGAENYDVEYVDNVDVGTAGVRVTGKNNYEGSFVYPFGIDPVDETRFLVVDLSGGTNATSYPVSYLSDVPAGAYYSDAVAWAMEEGITSGTGNGTFSPNAACTRGQVVTFLFRFEGVLPVSGGAPFADVDARAYYYDAVAWAVEKNVTQGTSATTFSPDQTCTRGQIVTFLYRAMTDGS